MFMLHVTPAQAAIDAVPTEPSAGDQRRAARALVESQMAALARLVEIGMELAEEAGRQARVPADERQLSDPALTYSRAARAVRLTIALQTRLAKDLHVLGREEGGARVHRIRRLVERVIEAECDDAAEIHQLSTEVRERLRDEESLDELAGRPIAEIVARICEDLGLEPEAWAEVLAPQDPPPLGEVPANGRGRGLQGADARDSALQPPTSASRPLPPRGADPGSGGSDPFASPRWGEVECAAAHRVRGSPEAD